MLPRNHPDRIKMDDRLVANAGLLLPATLALHLFPNWYSSAWTWVMRRAGPTPATR